MNYIGKLYKIFLRILPAFLLLITGCRAVKTRSNKSVQELKKDMEMNAVAVRTGVLERDVVRYWPDGRVYQLEQIRERMDEAELARIEMEESQSVKKDEVLREREPVRFWVYAAVGLALIAGVWVYKLFKN